MRVIKMPTLFFRIYKTNRLRVKQRLINKYSL